MSQTVRLRDLAKVVRSKNAKPYRLTLDVFFDRRDLFDYVRTTGALTPAAVASAYGIDPSQILSHYVFEEGMAFKFTLRRPVTQGSVGDSDMYGAQQHAPLLDVPIPWNGSAPAFTARQGAAIRLELGREILYLSQPDIEGCGFGMAEAVSCVERILRDKASGDGTNAPKPGLHPAPGCFFHAMLSMSRRLGTAALKWSAGFPDHDGQGLPYLQSLLILSDAGSGAPLAVMDAAWLTTLRTGAVSGLTARRLARPGASTMATLGCGAQAERQVEAISACVPGLRSVLCYDIVSENEARFVARMSEQHGHLEFMGTGNAETAVRQADVVVTAGPIYTDAPPTIEPGWFGAGTLALPIDFDYYWKPDAIALADRCFVDDMTQFEHFQRDGYLQTVPQPVGDLGDLLAGRVEGRRSDDERLFAVNLGISLEDLAVATPIFERCLAAGIGTILPAGTASVRR